MEALIIELIKILLAELLMLLLKWLFKRLKKKYH